MAVKPIVKPFKLPIISSYLSSQISPIRTLRTLLKIPLSYYLISFESGKIEIKTFVIFTQYVIDKFAIGMAKRKPSTLLLSQPQSCPSKRILSWRLYVLCTHVKLSFNCLFYSLEFWHFNIRLNIQLKISHTNKQATYILGQTCWWTDRLAGPNSKNCTSIFYKLLPS